jgi:lysophospholipase L1-like esterase
MTKKLFIPSLILNLILILGFILLTIYFPVYRQNYILKMVNDHHARRLSMFEAMPNDSAEIVFLGNSLVEACNWSELLENKNVKNRGIMRNTCEQVMKRLPEVLSAKPAKIFLMLGYDELRLGQNPEQVAKSYAKVLQEIRSKLPKARLYIHSLTPVLYKLNQDPIKNETIVIFNGKLKDLAQKFETYYIDIFTPLVGNQETNEIDPKYTNDGLHLKAEGYTRWKALLDQYLKD